MNRPLTREERRVVVTCLQLAKMRLKHWRVSGESGLPFQREFTERLKGQEKVVGDLAGEIARGEVG